jgi:molybdate transport system substrate-binding protein
MPNSPVLKGADTAREIKVFSTIGVRAAVEKLAPRFEQTTSTKLILTWATEPMLVKRMQAGETADVMILNLAGIDTMRKEGRVAPGSEIVLASSEVAIAVKAGAPKPDISTPEDLRAALLNARSVSYTDPAAGGASGVYFAQLLDRMGIADQVNGKTKYPPPGGFSGELLLTGEVELAIQQKPELMHVPGTDIVGPLPGDLSCVTVFAAAISTGSKSGAAAGAFIRFLRSPQASDVFSANGLDPL